MSEIEVPRFRWVTLVEPLAQKSRRSASRLFVHAIRFGCVLFLVWVAAIHLHLWSEGYKHIPTNGPLFLLDAVAGFAIAAALLLWPRPLAGLLGAAFMISTLAALIVSINFGLFGFRESSSATFVFQSLVLESVGTVTLLAWTGITLGMSARLIRPALRN